MKSKKLLLSTVVGLLGIATYIIFSSSSNASQGVMGSANSGAGCGSCHGSASANTTVTLEGIPATGYVSGTVYPVTLKITNSTKTKAGFDLVFSSGSISGNPTGTMLMGTELHHTQKFSAVSGVTSINFNWTAPTAAAVTLKMAGNAVNDNGSNNGDEWAIATVVFNKAIPASVANTIGTKLNVYPNPTSNNIIISTTEKINSVYAVDMLGKYTALQYNANGAEAYSINTSNLTSGNYLLLVKGEKENFHAVFAKQ